MMPEMEACYRAIGLKPKGRKGNKGCCSECHQSAKVAASSNPGSLYIGWLWCYKYDALCKRVAWNCDR